MNKEQLIIAIETLDKNIFALVEEKRNLYIELEKLQNSEKDNIIDKCYLKTEYEYTQSETWVKIIKITGTVVNLFDGIALIGNAIHIDSSGINIYPEYRMNSGELSDFSEITKEYYTELKDNAETLNQEDSRLVELRNAFIASVKK